MFRVYFCTSLCKNWTLTKHVVPLITISTSRFHCISFSSAFYTTVDFPDVEVSSVPTKLPNTYSWNSMMKSRCESGHYLEVLELYKLMTRLGIKCDRYTFPIFIKAIILLDADVTLGNMVHCVAAKTGFDLCIYFCNTIISFYGKSGFICDARQMFEEMPVRDAISLTSIMSQYVHRQDVFTAFQLFRNTQFEISANSVTLIVLSRCCWVCEFLTGGEQIHCLSTKIGLADDSSVRNSIFRLYCKMGSKAEVNKFLTANSDKDIIFFNTLIEFLCMIGCIQEAYNHFKQVNIKGMVSCETVTLLLPVLAESADLTSGEILHCNCIKRRILDDILLTSFLHFYAILGNVRNSRRLLEEISYKSNITWNAMMSGYIHNGCYGEAVKLFSVMDTYDAEILTRLVDSLSFMGLTRHGRAIHGHVVRNCEKSIRLFTSILRMYSRNGNNSVARTWFDEMELRDVVTWTAMIEGHAACGEGFEAVKLFDEMVREGISPNEATFLSLLCGCSHSGLVSLGCEVFLKMKWVYKMEPSWRHYTCMVDMLARSGRLKEALGVIMKMRVDGDGRMWGALLGACRLYGDFIIGGFAAMKLLEIGGENAGDCAVLGSILFDFGYLERAEKIRDYVCEGGYRITPATSCTIP